MSVPEALVAHHLKWHGEARRPWIDAAPDLVAERLVALEQLHGTGPVARPEGNRLALTMVVELALELQHRPDSVLTHDRER